MGTAGPMTEDNLLRSLSCMGTWKNMVLDTIMLHTGGCIHTFSDDDVEHLYIWYKWRRQIYVLNTIHDEYIMNIYITIDAKKAYNALFPRRAELARHYRVLHKIRPTIKPPENFICQYIYGEDNGLYTVQGLLKQNRMIWAVYVYTPIGWLYIPHGNGRNPWTLLQTTYNVEGSEWNSTVATQIIQHIIGGMVK